MTNKYCGFIVVLDQDLRHDDAQALVGAIKLLRGVLTVTPLAADANYQTAELRARIELNERLLKILKW